MGNLPYFVAILSNISNSSRHPYSNGCSGFGGTDDVHDQSYPSMPVLAANRNSSPKLKVLPQQADKVRMEHSEKQGDREVCGRSSF